MIFEMHVKDIHSDWWESVNRNTSDPQKTAEEIVQSFNKSLRPHEAPRELIEIRVTDERQLKHEWVKRTDGMSVNFRGRAVDLMYCTRCHITGKRYGLNGLITIDSKFRKKAFRECDTALIAMKKLYDAD